MELYRKKINIETKPGRRGRDRNTRTENNPKKNVYIQKMIQQSQPPNESFDLSATGDNIHNVRSNMEEIFANDEKKKKAIKYVIEIGRNKKFLTAPRTVERHQKSVSPRRHQKGGRGNIFQL